MKRSIFWMMAAIMTVCGPLVSCSEHDNPVAADDVQQTYQYESDVDKGVAPGDDFWQYAVGSWLSEHQANPGESGTNEEADAKGEAWLEAMTTASSADPLVAELCRRVSNVQAEFDGSVARLHKTIDRIEAITTREELFTEMGRLMGQGYPVAIDWEVNGNKERLYVVFQDASYSEYDELEGRLRELKFSEEQISGLMAVAKQFYRDVKKSDGAPRQSIHDRSYWQNADNVRRLIPMSTYLSRAAKTRADGSTAAELLLKGMDLSADHVMLSDKKVMDFFSSYDELAATAQGLDIIKKLMQLGIVQRDYPILDILSVKDLFEFINEGRLRPVHYQLSKIFYEQMVSAEALNYVRTMADEFRNCFARRLDRLDWLSDATRQRAHKKLQAMDFILGLPQEWDEDFFLKRLPDGLTFYESVLWILHEGDRIVLRKQLGKSTPGSIYIQLCNDMPAWVNNAQYSPNFNCIYLPGNSLIAPMVDTSLGDGYNYGVLGASTIGHEMTHGFDNIGSKYNEMGLVENWWEPADTLEFKRRKQAMIDHFNQLKIGDRPVDGSLTLNENIADQGGMNMALDIIKDRARQKGLGEQATREELRRLFLGWAQAWKSNRDLAIYYKKMDGKDVHAQYPVRVNGQVSLISDWYELFDVREGQKLYVAPEKRFYIW